jgi:hypothetical protein
VLFWNALFKGEVTACPAFSFFEILLACARYEKSCCGWNGADIKSS